MFASLKRRIDRGTSRLLVSATATLLMASAAVTNASGEVVNSFAPFTLTPTPGEWRVSDVRTGTTSTSTASIVDLTGVGGNLETNQPLPTGAAKLTTDATNPSMAEVGVADDYGLAGQIISNLTLAYDYYKAAGSPSNAPAPSLKLSFFNPAAAGDNFVSLIYEPYWNNGGAAVTGAWTNVAISATSGLFWQNGGFGQANSAGGPPLNTLSGWLSTFDAGFANATLVDLRVGIGTFNPSETVYFDNVKINNGAGINRTYDFEAAAPVPLPAAAWAGFALIGGLGGAKGLRRFRRVQE